MEIITQEIMIQINVFLDLPLQDLALYITGIGIFLVIFSFRRIGEEKTDYYYGIHMGNFVIPTTAVVTAGGTVGMFWIIAEQSKFIATAPLGLVGSIILGGGSALFYQKVYELVKLRQLPEGSIVLQIKIQLIAIGLVITSIGSVISYGIISPQFSLSKVVLFSYTLFVFISSSAGVGYRLLIVQDEISDFSFNTYAQYTLIIGIILITAGASITEFTFEHEIYSILLSKIAYGCGFLASVSKLYT